ncbi:MAG: DUF1592 domain-containing protein [Acidobacteriota bacterium]
MKRTVLLIATAALLILSRGFAPLDAAPQASQRPASPAAAQAKPAVASPTATHKALVDRYCAGCHNSRTKIAGLALDVLDLNKVGPDGEIWEKAARKLRAGMMPPPGAPQPERAAVEAFVSYLETSLDAYAAANPNPGVVALHRLNRAEYANAIEDLLGVRVDAAALLPTDDVSDGFDNIAGVLKTSPSFLDQYVSAARTVTVQAVGTPMPEEPQRVTLRGGITGDPTARNGVPLGMRATMLVDYLFPADGEYEFRMGGAGGGAGGGGRGGPGGGAAAGGAGRGAPPPAANDNVVTVDGVRVALTGRVTLKAGTHRVGVSAPPRSLTESEALLQSFVPGGAGGGAGGGGGGGRGGGGAGALTVAGPYNAVGPKLDTPSRQKIFVCRPANQSEEEACATKIFTSMARRAFRRTVAEKDIVAAMRFFRDGRSRGDFDAGIQTGLMTIFASPKFLYRAEYAPPSAQPGTINRISDLELASRLSFFLWSSTPDEALLTAAEQGRLKDPAVLQQQVRRMLANPRSKALVDNFAFEWLKLRDVDKIDPDVILFPNFDNGLRTAFRREAELFLKSIIDEDRSVIDIVGANYSFLNERLAAHYGIPDIRGDQYRKVTLADSRRWGILGKGAMLMVTSYPNRTAPVLRGAWILENLAGTPPAAPPPNVEGFKENKDGEKALTIRQIMQEHRANPTCNACHGVMDPLGFSLENFDAVGAWRSKDKWANAIIDASGQLVDGSPVAGPDDLRKALLKKPDQFARTMTEKMLTYALGRRAEHYDMPAVRRIVKEAARDNYKYSSLVMAIVNSEPFQKRKLPAPAAKAVAANPQAAKQQ